MNLLVRCRKCENFGFLDFRLGKEMLAYYQAVFVCPKCNQVNLMITFARKLDQYRIFELENDSVLGENVTAVQRLEYIFRTTNYVLNRLDVREHFGISDQELASLIALNQETLARKIAEYRRNIDQKLPDSHMLAIPIDDEEVEEMGRGFDQLTEKAPSDEELGL